MREVMRLKEIRETIEALISQADCDALELVNLYHNQDTSVFDIEEAIAKVTKRKEYLLNIKKVQYLA